MKLILANLSVPLSDDQDPDKIMEWIGKDILDYIKQKY